MARLSAQGDSDGLREAKMHPGIKGQSPSSAEHQLAKITIHCSY
jgi:hypothetical protein